MRDAQHGESTGSALLDESWVGQGDHSSGTLYVDGSHFTLYNDGFETVEYSRGGCAHAY